MSIRRIAWTFALLLVMVISSVAVPPPGAPTAADPEAWEGLDSSVVERVKSGEIVIANTLKEIEGGKRRFIQAAMTFDVNLLEVYNLLKEETPKQCEYLSSCDESILIEGADDYNIVEFRAVVIGWEIKYRVRHEWDDEKFRIWWALDPTFDNGLKQLEGYWHFFYMDESHTLARYGTKLVLRDFIPMRVQEILARRELPQNLLDVRMHVNSQETYKKN